MPTYTFLCPNGHSFDKRVSLDTYQVTSDAFCGCVATAQRLSVYRVSFKGFTPTPRDERTYHQEFRDFREAGAELEYNHSRMEEAAGATLSKPPLGRIAKANAKALMKAGVTSSEDWKSRKKH